jgi:hypothetical protein
VRAGDCDALEEAVGQLANYTVDGWSLAMAKVAKLERVSPEIQNAFLGVWTESKMLALNVGRRATLAKALRLLLPGPRPTAPVRLYRGARDKPGRRVHGFSWSAERAIAERFAENNRGPELGAVLLETLAPPEAVLHVRENIEGYYAESEYIVDPYALKRVRVIARYPSNAPAPPPSDLVQIGS